MFVRFRKLPNDGFEPAAADDAAFRACQEPHYKCRKYQRCRSKPRCRWLIGKHTQLQPYRLKVILVENKRVNGKVKQETIAMLGSINAVWLPEFWDGVENADELKCKNWEMYSIQHRTAFWETANERLKQLANRLGPDAKRIRIAAHSRVPWPMEAERDRLELLETKHNYDYWKSYGEFIQGQADRQKKTVEDLQREIAEGEASARDANQNAATAARIMTKLMTS